jgi:glutamate decarboxylase
MDQGIPALCWKLKDESAATFTLYDFANTLRSRGWQVPAYSMPANRKDLVVQRILVRHGVSRDLAGLLLDDMKRSLEFFDKHPQHASMTPEEASGFAH